MTDLNSLESQQEVTEGVNPVPGEERYNIPLELQRVSKYFGTQSKRAKRAGDDKWAAMYDRWSRATFIGYKQLEDKAKTKKTSKTKPKLLVSALFSNGNTYYFRNGAWQESATGCEKTAKQIFPKLDGLLRNYAAIAAFGGGNVDDPFKPKEIYFEIPGKGVRFGYSLGSTPNLTQWERIEAQHV